MKSKKCVNFGENGSLYLGDCCDILPLDYDAIVTKPPCSQDDDDKIGPEIIRLCLSNSIDIPMIVYCGARMLWDYPKPRELGFVSTPGNMGIKAAGDGKWGFVTGHPILYYGKDPHRNKMLPNGFTSYDYLEENEHPCPKPIRWMLWAVAKASREGETILDPFIGSGETAVSCIRSNRRFVGIEKDPKCFDTACSQIKKELRQGVLF